MHRHSINIYVYTYLVRMQHAKQVGVSSPFLSIKRPLKSIGPTHAGFKPPLSQRGLGNSCNFKIFPRACSLSMNDEK